MSFFKAFNSCCPFLLAPTLDTDDYAESFEDDEGKYNYELNEITQGNSAKPQYQTQLINSKCNNIQYMNTSGDINAGNNVSDIILNEILKEIIY